MANPLTGDFDAAVEVHVEALNRILATLHQKKAFEGASPSLLHSITARIGDVPKDPKLELARAFVLRNFGEATADRAALTDEILARVQTGLVNVRRTLLNIAKTVTADDPSGSRGVVHAMLPELFVVRGTAKVQISTLRVTFPEGTTSEATVHCDIRALYIPDPGTAALPAPIHGEVQVGFVVKHDPKGEKGQPVLEVEVTSDDGKIQFIPADGTSLTFAETKLIASQIR